MKKKFSTLSNKPLLLCLAALIIATVAAVTAFISAQDKKPLSETRFLLDTVCTVTLYDTQDESLLDGAFDVCSRYDKMLGVSVSSSDIYKINHSKGNPVEVSKETASLLGRALEYCRLSGGEFDITIYPVKSLWNFSGEEAGQPDKNRLEKAVKSVDYRKINISGNKITLPKGMGIDLGAIAKGFIADRIADYLRSSGVKSAIIDLGGNVYALGCKPDGGNWRIGIRMPFADGEADIAEVSDKSVVTSGVYQRYFEADGKIYHHILRSSDGMPCDTGLYSVTVISDNSERCDALSTVCMLLGYDRSIELLSQLDSVEAIFITSDYSVLHYRQ